MPRFQPIHLEDALKRLGMGNLSHLVGYDRIEAFDSFGQSITETKMVQILLCRHGSQLLSNKEIRVAILDALPDPLLGYIFDGQYDANRQVRNSCKDSVKNIQWSRTGEKPKRVLSIFGLDDNHLPPQPTALESHIKVTPNSTLYNYQRRVKDRLIRFLSKNNRVLLHMPTGSGKTKTSIEGIVDYWRSTADRDGLIIWLAHSQELCEQAFDSLKSIWLERGDSPIDMFRLWGKHSIDEIATSGNGFIVASLQKIHSMKLTSSNEVFAMISGIKTKCRMIVIDEAHKAIAPTYKTSIEFISNVDKTKLVGLTATPGRGFDQAETRDLVEFFDGNKISITDDSGKDVDDPIRFLQDNQYLARVKRKPVLTNIELDLTDSERDFVTNFLDLPPSVLKKLSKDSKRNALILAEIINLHARGKFIIVFALSVEHAHLLTELLLLKKISVRCVDGSTPTKDRSCYLEEYKSGEVNILINYGVLTTGFDAPRTNAVVITRPTGSLVLYSQMLGRGIRGPKMGGNIECELVDLEDNLLGFPRDSQAFTYFDQAWT
ncbi:MAG: DEAD/DEAH box helicase [Nitrospina sp.]|jgi:DNA repair protein RadD|nr:DEAD/DEAH box helicase [Nitrospina sp.]